MRIGAAVAVVLTLALAASCGTGLPSRYPSYALAVAKYAPEGAPNPVLLVDDTNGPTTIVCDPGTRMWYDGRWVCYCDGTWVFFEHDHWYYYPYFNYYYQGMAPRYNEPPRRISPGTSTHHQHSR